MGLAGLRLRPCPGTPPSSPSSPPRSPPVVAGMPPSRRRRPRRASTPPPRCATRSRRSTAARRTTSRGSNQLQTADRARRARRRVRLRQPDRGAGALPGRPLHAPGHVRDQRARAARAEREPRPACARSTACAPAAAGSRSARAGVPIGDYTRRVLRAPPADADPAHQHGQQRAERLGHRVEGRARLRRRRLRLRHRRTRRGRPRERDPAAALGAAAGALPALRGPAPGGGHGGRARVHPPRRGPRAAARSSSAPASGCRRVASSRRARGGRLHRLPRALPGRRR